MYEQEVPEGFIVQVYIFSCCLEWNIYVHAKQSGNQSGWEEDDSEATENCHDFVFDREVQESLLDSCDCSFDRMVVMSNSVDHELKHDLLLLIIVVILLELLEEHRLFLHVNFEMCELILRIENSLNEILSLYVVNSHRVFQDISRFIDQLIRVWQDAEKRMIYNREQNIIAVNIFDFLPILGLFAASRCHRL